MLTNPRDTFRRHCMSPNMVPCDMLGNRTVQRFYNRKPWPRVQYNKIYLHHQVSVTTEDNTQYSRYYIGRIYRI